MRRLDDVVRVPSLLIGAIVLVSAAAGCAGYPNNLAPGQTCVRSAQCGSGLVCSMGVCTNDLTMFGGGHPTSLDAGAMDAFVDDAAIDMDADIDVGMPEDMGPLPDMGPIPDMGPLPDTFIPGVDAFVPPVDAFVPPVDAFTPPVDAFVPPVDAFVEDDADIDVGP